MQALQPAAQAPQEYLMKVMVVGDVHVGKTSLIKRYVHGTFGAAYKPTIGVDFGLKIIQRDSSNIRLQLWDVGGQERFGNMTRVYYKEAVAAIVIADISRPQTCLDGAVRWKDDIRAKEVRLPNGKDISIILLANKSDMRSDKDTPAATKASFLTDAQLQATAEENGFDGHYITSAKTGDGIDQAMTALVSKVLELGLGPKPVEASPSSRTVQLGGSSSTSPPVSTCGC